MYDYLWENNQLTQIFYSINLSSQIQIWTLIIFSLYNPSCLLYLTNYMTTNRLKKQKRQESNSPCLKWTNSSKTRTFSSLQYHSLTLNPPSHLYPQNYYTTNLSSTYVHSPSIHKQSYFNRHHQTLTLFPPIPCLATHKLPPSSHHRPYHHPLAGKDNPWSMKRYG